MSLSGIPDLVLLDLQDSLVGGRLCETGVGVLAETGTASWQSAGAVDRRQWVNQIRTTSTITGALPAPGGRARELAGG
jgi:hypothetical protein